MLAMAATIAVAYPHMNGIGGDGFWLIAAPGETPIGIQACGRAAQSASRESYLRMGFSTVPPRGGAATLTVAGTVAGWQTASEIAKRWGGRIPRARLLADAIDHARDGVPVSPGQERLAHDRLGELHAVFGFSQSFLVDGRPPASGSRLRNSALASTLEHLAAAGFGDFYKGDIAASLARDLRQAGSPISLQDIAATSAPLVEPLSLQLGGVKLFNLPPPTQGAASLMILALFERLKLSAADEFSLIHGLVEATKQAFAVRDAKIGDPAGMDVAATDLLTDERLERMAENIDCSRAAPWPHASAPGDTVWMGAMDRDGRAVSFIQSLYWEFGSGVVSPSTGILWQNRGHSFALDERHPNRLEPGRLPFHTLNPALALFDDGRTMVYGTMGGDGQPQTQAAVFARYAWAGYELQEAITAPRWLLGRTWGAQNTNLKLESRFAPELLDRLRKCGHEVEAIEPFSDLVGHAGAVARYGDGLLEGAADPRSDGAAVGI
jgi:gamma-glutamyltranspeptidase/glutathione hydrolase